MFYVFSFPPDVYVRTLNLIASILGPSFLTLRHRIHSLEKYFYYVLCIMSVVYVGT